MKIKVNIRTGSEAPASYNGWRVRHKIEQGWQNTPPGMPEVMPPSNPLSLDMGYAIQQMSYSLMTSANSAITKQLWTAVHDHDRAFTNFNGFNNPGDPRANFVTGENIGAPLPKYDKAQRVCGGSFIHGVPDISGVLRCTAGVDGIDADEPMPDAATIIKNNWYIYAVSVNSDFTQISHFPQGMGGPVLIPFIFRGVIEFPLQHFETWEAGTLPDPLKVYNG